MAARRTVMNAIRVQHTGGPEVLQLDAAVPVPTPGPGELLVRTEATGVNFIEVYQRTGLYPVAMPGWTPGTEVAGVVEALGEGTGAAGFTVGDRVVTTMAKGGSYAEFTLCPVERTSHVPAGVTTREAAAVMLQGMTAHYLTRSTFPLSSGHTCVVHAAAGGTGLLLIQAAKMVGARVIGTVSTEDKAALARAAGADEVILYTQTPEFDVEVRRLVPNGVDVVYDSVGRTTFDRSLRCLRTRGMLVSFGQASGAVPPFELARLSAGALFLTRPSLMHYIATKEDFLWRSREVLEWVANKKLNVRIGLELPLAKAADAHVAIESRGTTGKVILVP